MNQFTCPECNKVLRINAELGPGKKIRCPACNTVFAPIADGPPTASPVRPAPAAAPPPARRGGEFDFEEGPAPRRPAPMDDRPRRRDDDDYDRDSPRNRDDYDDRPQPRRKKSGRLFWIVGGGVLLLLVGFLVTAFLWPGFLLSRGRSANLEPLLAHMPANPKLLVAVDLTNLNKRNKLEELLAKMPQMMTQQGDTPEVLKVIANDMVAFLAASSSAQEPEMMAIRTKADFDPEKIKSATKATAVPGKNYFRIARRGSKDPNLLAMPDKRTLLLSSLPENEFEKLITADKTRMSKDVRDLADRTGGAVVWGVVSLDLPGMNPMNQIRDMPINPAKMDKVAPALKTAKYVALWLDSSSGVKINVALACAGGKEAGDISSAFNEAWSEAKAKLRAEMAKSPVPIPGVNELIDSVRISSSGNLAIASAGLSRDTTNSLVAMAEMMGGFNGFPGIGGGGGPKRDAFPRDKGDFRFDDKFDKFNFDFKDEKAFPFDKFGPKDLMPKDFKIDKFVPKDFPGFDKGFPNPKEFFDDKKDLKRDLK